MQQRRADEEHGGVSGADEELAGKVTVEEGNCLRPVWNLATGKSAIYGKAIYLGGSRKSRKRKKRSSGAADKELCRRAGRGLCCP